MLLLLLCSASALAQDAPGERFVPSTMGSGATVELRSEAVVVGDNILLRQMLRWSDQDRSAMDPWADLVVARFPASGTFVTITLEQVKTVLHDAGANLGLIRFTGSTSCTVSRSDVKFDEGKALREWVTGEPRPTTRSAAAVPAVDGRTLRDLLLADLSERLTIPAEALQVRFDPKDESVLRMVDGMFRFEIDGRRARGLGDVRWDVTVLADGARQRVSIAANARAWQTQAVVARPIAARQLIGESDVVERRTLSDRMPEDAVGREAILGQQAARELPLGTVVTARMVTAVPMVHRGQLVSVTVQSANVQIKTVAEAREDGVLGQTIRVRKPNTTEDFHVIVSGPQQAKMMLPQGGRGM